MVELSVIIPMYNEGRKIYKNVEKLEKTLSDLKLDYELILVNDGSTDNTEEEISRVKSDRVKTSGYAKNRGKGYAILYGVKHASGEFVTFIDADMELDPEQISIFLEYLEKNNADVVIGSKRHPLSRIDYPISRRILSIGYNLLLRLIFGLSLTDTQAGFKLFREKVIVDVAPKMRVRRYAFDVEILAYANQLGYKIIEAPVILNFDREGLGRINFRDVFRIGVDTAAIAYRFKIPQYYAGILRDSGTMVVIFIALVILYKAFKNPYVFPEIENRTLYVLAVLGIIIIILNLPYDKLSERMG